jgi:hypothetical protein
MTTTTPHRPTAYDRMYETWRTTGKMPPMPTEYSPGAMDSWMELTWDIACIDVFKEIRKGEKPK